MNKKSIITAVIAVVAVIAIIIACVFGVQSSGNGAINREEQVNAAKSNINVVEMERQTLLTNLADAVKSYDKHEYETLVAVINARGANFGEEGIREISTLVEAVAEKYPDLKSHENYKAFMTEATILERQIKDYRENYNSAVKEYRDYCRGFPTRFFLNWVGYEKIDFQYLEYNTTAEGPSNLFGNTYQYETVPSN